MFQNLSYHVVEKFQEEPYQAEFDFVIKFYGADFNSDLLETQLEVLYNSCTEKLGTSVVISEIVEFFKSLTLAQKEHLSEVCKLLKLLLVMPATNATSERSFSSLRRIKSYLRSTMNQERL